MRLERDLKGSVCIGTTVGLCDGNNPFVKTDLDLDTVPIRFQLEMLCKRVSS